MPYHVKVSKSQSTIHNFYFLDVIAAETTVIKEVPVTDDHDDDDGKTLTAAPVKTRKVSTAVYKTAENLPLESKTLANIEMFKDGKLFKVFYN